MLFLDDPTTCSFFAHNSCGACFLSGPWTFRLLGRYSPMILFSTLIKDTFCFGMCICHKKLYLGDTESWTIYTMPGHVNLYSSLSSPSVNMFYWFLEFLLVTFFFQLGFPTSIGRGEESKRTKAKHIHFKIFGFSFIGSWRRTATWGVWNGGEKTSTQTAVTSCWF